ncbi:MAG TPA: serine/threonine-protein kinase [Gemmataceae bacterium]|nr:serine/threonine-protein kinase [Gemmataceae bacterium]
MAADFSTPDHDRSTQPPADPASLSSRSPPVPPPTEMLPPAIEGYEIQEVLGKGAMGIVYKAKQTAADRSVALKMILGGFADEDARARFRREALAVAAMNHPNIVQMFDVAADEAEPYFTLEFCAGGSLAGRLRDASLPPAEAARLIETLARAVHHAHQRHVIHRDLKPANILLQTTEDTENTEKRQNSSSAFSVSSMVPKISDFGLAKRLDDAGNTQSGAVMGTPSYMAWEQAAGKGKEIGPATDVYALGAILYECLTGRPPFNAATTLDTLLQVIHDDPLPPRQLQPKTPRDLETICLKCLQKDPKRRYTGADVLAEDLRRFQAHEPITARPVGFLERSWRWCRRKPKNAALIAAGALAIGLGVFAYIWIAGARQAAEQDRRDRQARATTQAESRVAEADLLWEQAKSAHVDDLIPWEKAFAAAGQAKQVIDANAVDEPTRRHVERTWNGVAAGKQETEIRKQQADRDERMKAELQKLVYSQLQLTSEGAHSTFSPPLADAEFERVFRTYYRIDLNRRDEAEASIRTSAIKGELIAALDAWIPLRPDARSRRELADMINGISEPDDFRHEVREALVTEDRARLVELAKRDMSALPPHELFTLAWAFLDSQAWEAAEALLRPAQLRYPGDFGLNLLLGNCLLYESPPHPDEAAPFSMAAVALKPEDAEAHNLLGNIFARLGKQAEAAAQYKRAIELDTTFAKAHSNLGIVLEEQGKIAEAVEEYNRAIVLDPNFAWAHNNLGNVLNFQGKTTEAVAQFKYAIELDSSLAEFHSNLAMALSDQGRHKEAVAECRRAIELGPGLAAAYYNLGWGLNELGEFEEALNAFKRSKELLEPGDPRLQSLEVTLDKVQRSRILEDQLDAIAKGEIHPPDAAEGLDYARLCSCKSLPAAAAKLYEAGFRADPALAHIGQWWSGVDRPVTLAARAAALAGSGQGKNAGELTDADRAYWRKQSLAWLRADLDAWVKQTAKDDPKVEKAESSQLRIWQRHVDFAGVRDEVELKKLPPDEQAEWRQFWTDVQAAVDRAEMR